jgi:DNA-binding LacI/PurR family transcriptional regulator
VLGVLAPLTGGMYFGGVIRGIARQAATVGGHVVAVQTVRAGIGHDYEAEPAYDEPLGWDHVAGFIVIVNAVPAAHLAAIQASGKPLVMISEEVRASTARSSSRTTERVSRRPSGIS